MTHQSPTTSPSNARGQSGLSLYGVLSVAFVLVLFLQLFRSINVDTFGLDGTRLDLIGFLFCHAAGALLIVRAAASRRLMVDTMLLCFVLITYIALIVATTSMHASLLDVLFSRYGILNWLLLGIGTASAASYIHLPVGTRQARAQRAMFIGSALLIGGLLVYYAFRYLNSPVYSLRYQSVADSLTLILLTLMILTQVIWRGRPPIPVVIGVVVIGTLAVTAVARLQSTSIVGFWIAGLLIYFTSTIAKLPRQYRILFFVVVAIVGLLYLSSGLFADTLQNTRFAEILTTGRLSSIDSRLALLGDFGRQFAVSPIFGNFSAEVLAGSGIGNYPHSLTSFLTHTGLLGTSLLVVIMAIIVSRRLPLNRLSAPDLQQLLFLGAIVALGALFAFMTWSVFWFILGFMCKTPIAKAAGEAR